MTLIFPLLCHFCYSPLCLPFFFYSVHLLQFQSMMNLPPAQLPKSFHFSPVPRGSLQLQRVQLLDVECMLLPLLECTSLPVPLAIRANFLSRPQFRPAYNGDPECDDALWQYANVYAPEWSQGCLIWSRPQSGSAHVYPCVSSFISRGRKRLVS